MIVGYGTEGTVLIALTEHDLAVLRGGRTLTFEGEPTEMRRVVMVWGKDAAHVVQQLKGAGVEISTDADQTAVTPEG